MKSEQDVINRFNQLRQEVQSIWGKMNELRAEREEHDLVTDALKPLDPQRRCFRLVGGVLVERTVTEVLPAVQRNREGLTQLLAKLEEQLESKKKTLNDFQEKYKIRVKGEDKAVDAEAEAGVTAPTQGILA